jgi:hypothetical protein
MLTPAKLIVLAFAFFFVSIHSFPVECLNFVSCVVSAMEQSVEDYKKKSPCSKWTKKDKTWKFASPGLCREECDTKNGWQEKTQGVCWKVERGLLKSYVPETLPY